MTITERNNKLKHLITCMKCEVSGKVCDDNCPTQYNAGNMGEIIENLEAISKALEQEPKLEREHDHEILRTYADGANNVLDKVRAEIEQHAYPIVHGVNNHELGMTLYGILQVIDKYKAESDIEKQRMTS